MKLDPRIEATLREHIDNGLAVIAVPTEHLKAMLEDIEQGRRAAARLERYERSVDSLGGGPA